jgi:Flp pilus assembly protein TadD
MFFFMKKIDVNFKKPPQQQLNSLLELYQTGKYPDAEKLSLSITQEFPEYQFAWKVLGATLKQMGKINESLVASQKSVQLEPQDSEAHNNLGVTLKELDRLSEAEASYRKAIRLKPDYAEAQSNLGIILQKLGRLDEAEASYRKAIRLKPDYAEAQTNLGFILQKLGRLDEAEARYKKAIVLKPDNTKVHFGLGVLYKKQGKFEKAAERFRKVLVDDSNNYQARYHLGSTLENEAKLHYSQAFEGADTKYKLDVVDQNLKYFVKKDIQIDEKIINLLNKLSQSINKLYGFSFAESSRIAVQSINLGPCGPFANEFYKQWNSRFINEVKIAFIMHQLPFECRHVLIKLPNSRLFDGGIGVHDFNIYKGNSAELVVMEKYDLKVLDKYAWGLIRTYPHIHHDFSISKISVLIAKYLDNIYKT